MKAQKLIGMFVALVVLAFGSTQAQTSTSSSNLAKISFDKTVLDFGTLKIGAVKTIKVGFTNTGKKPLILDNVKSNCDCTEVQWSKTPVMPGKKGFITVKYTAKHKGLISKWVTVDSNAENDRVVLKTKGEVK